MKIKTKLVKQEEAKNKYNVPDEVWDEWSKKARLVFNRVYDFIYENRAIVLHPKHRPFPKADHWQTIAWNSAWIAADAVDNTLPAEVVTEKRAA